MRKRTQTVYAQRVIQGWRLGYRKPASGECVAIAADQSKLPELLHHYSHPTLVGVLTNIELPEIIARLKPSDDADVPRWAKAVAAALVVAVIVGLLGALEWFGVRTGMVRADSSAFHLLDSWRAKQ